MRKQKGITLLALVITIIVLIILAGVTISALLGDDGIVGQAEDAETKTNQSGEIEQIQMAYNALYMQKKANKKETDPMTAINLKTRLEKMGAKLSTTNPNPVTYNDGVFTIEFESGGNYSVNVATKEIIPIEDETENVGSKIPVGMYSVNDEVTPAPQELFEFVVLDENAKTAKITGMNNNYIVRKVASAYIGYYGEFYTGTDDLYGNTIDSYYYINHPYITDTLVVPYQVEMDGQMYTVTEVNLNSKITTKSKVHTSAIPNIQTIIYPNTVTKIGTKESVFIGSYLNRVEEIVLSDNLKEIGDGGVMASCPNLKNITIPYGVTKIGNHTFDNCSSLTSVTIPNSVTSIGEYAFANCSGLTSITIPNSVTSIGSSAFDNCTSITSVTIPNSVTSIGEYAFGYWTASQTINCQATSKPTNWNSKWNYYNYNTTNKATIKWGVSN